MVGRGASIRSGQLWCNRQFQVQPFTKGILVARHPCSQETMGAGTVSFLSPFISGLMLGSIPSLPNAAKDGEA